MYLKITSSLHSSECFMCDFSTLFCIILLATDFSCFPNYLLAIYLIYWFLLCFYI